MKYWLLFISLFSLCLIGSRAVAGVLPEAEAAADVSIVCMDAESLMGETDMGTILPVESSSPLDAVAFMEVDWMARQLGAYNRSYRLTSSSYSCLTKALIRRIAILRMAVLTHSATQVFSTLPCQSWHVSSEHYVFGMRRILI